MGRQGEPFHSSAGAACAEPNPGTPGGRVPGFASGWAGGSQPLPRQGSDAPYPAGRASWPSAPGETPLALARLEGGSSPAPAAGAAWRGCYSESTVIAACRAGGLFSG